MRLAESGIIKDKSCETVAEGLKCVCASTGLCGRWQQLQISPRIVCDTGHNVAGWEYISRQLATQRYRRMRIVFGMVDDKDLNRVIQLITSINASWINCQAKHQFFMVI